MRRQHAMHLPQGISLAMSRNRDVRRLHTCSAFEERVPTASKAVLWSTSFHVAAGNTAGHHIKPAMKSAYP